MNEVRQRAMEDCLDRLTVAYNAHDPARVAECFSDVGSLEDAAYGATFKGRAAIAEHYGCDFRGAYDIMVERVHTFASDRALASELRVRATHTGTWHGLPATGSLLRLRVWMYVVFSADDRRIDFARLDYDRASVLEQLGVLHDRSSALGRAVTVLTHPLTMARAARRRISEAPPPPHP